MSPQPPSTSELRRDFGIDASTLAPHEGGWEAACWVADDRWFVKVWHDQPRNLELLGQLDAAGLPIAVPVRTADGRLSAECDAGPYGVFPYVRGRHATGEDWAECARLLRRLHGVTGVDLPRATLEEECLANLRERLDHPWLDGRGAELGAQLERLEEVIERARATDAKHIVCHNDFGGHNLLIGDDGRALAILDWDHASWAPREHDLWTLVDEPYAVEMLDAYGACDLDPTHLEYALLARALRDLTARVCAEVDRPGVTTWGFDRLDRLDSILELARPYCR